MPWPVTINGKTYTAGDFAPYGYATSFPNILQDVADVAQSVVDAAAASGVPAAEINIASAATTDIGAVTNSRIAITGTTTISSFGNAVNRLRFVRFTSSLTLNFNATSLILPGGTNIVTQAGDTLIAMSNGSGNWRVYDYQRADGTPLSYGSDPNVLINSAFDNWQRSASPDTPINCPVGAYTYLADRVAVLADGAAVTQNRTFGIPPGSKARMSLQVNGAPGNTGVHVILQRIESREIPRIKRFATFRIAVYNSTGAAFTPQVYFARPGSTDAWSNNPVYSGSDLQPCPAGAWTVCSLVFDFSTLSNIDNGLHIEMLIPSGVLNATSKYVLFSEMDLRPGTTVAPFDRRAPETDLAMCRRYFQPVRICRQFYSGGGSNTYRDMIPINYPAMRAAPTLVLGTPIYTSGNFSMSIDQPTATGLNIVTDPTASGAIYYTYNATLSAEL